MFGQLLRRGGGAHARRARGVSPQKRQIRDKLPQGRPITEVNLPPRFPKGSRTTRGKTHHPGPGRAGTAGPRRLPARLGPEAHRRPGTGPERPQGSGREAARGQRLGAAPLCPGDPPQTQRRGGGPSQPSRPRGAPATPSGSHSRPRPTPGSRTARRRRPPRPPPHEARPRRAGSAAGQDPRSTKEGGTGKRHGSHFQRYSDGEGGL